MKKVTLMATLLLVYFSAYAQQSLVDQIDAVDAAQTQEQQMEAQQQRAAIARAKQKYAAAVALQQKKEADALADKKREQAYQDQLRVLDVQRKALEVEAEKARVARTNEYIDQELKAQAAQTDAVQSQADANRNISSGTKTLLEDTGKAEVESQSGFFRRFFTKFWK